MLYQIRHLFNLFWIRVKKYPLIFTSFGVLTVLICINAQQIAIGSIELYQKYISPHKGCHCAYSALHKDIPCSTYGKRVIAEKGALKGLFLLSKRFVDCKKAAITINSERNHLKPVVLADSGNPCFDCGEGTGKGFGMMIILGIALFLIFASGRGRY